VVDAAPRIDSRLLAALVRLQRRDRSIAETNRRLGELAESLGLPRPSYERVRALIQEHRRRPVTPGAGEILLDIALQTQRPEAFVDYLAGTLPPKRPK
jgi:hypothetical protein